MVSVYYKGWNGGRRHLWYHLTCYAYLFMLSWVINFNCLQFCICLSCCDPAAAGGTVLIFTFVTIAISAAAVAAAVVADLGFQA
eukprot:COSAG01_NODE_1777_length_9258_cov_7.865284_5_plen_84_part_00